MRAAAARFGAFRPISRMGRRLGACWHEETRLERRRRPSLYKRSWRLGHRRIPHEMQAPAQTSSEPRIRPLLQSMQLAVWPQVACSLEYRMEESNSTHDAGGTQTVDRLQPPFRRLPKRLLSPKSRLKSRLRAGLPTPQLAENYVVLRLYFTDANSRIARLARLPDILERR